MFWFWGWNTGICNLYCSGTNYGTLNWTHSKTYSFVSIRNYITRLTREGSFLDTFLRFASFPNKSRCKDFSYFSVSACLGLSSFHCPHSQNYQSRHWKWKTENFCVSSSNLWFQTFTEIDSVEHCFSQQSADPRRSEFQASRWEIVSPRRKTSQLFSKRKQNQSWMPLKIMLGTHSEIGVDRIGYRWISFPLL